MFIGRRERKLLLHRAMQKIVCIIKLDYVCEIRNALSKIYLRQDDWACYWWKEEFFQFPFHNYKTSNFVKLNKHDRYLRNNVITHTHKSHF